MSIPSGVSSFIPLSQYSHLRVGGVARFFVVVTTTKKLISVLSWWRGRDPHLRRVRCISGGTNVFFADGLFNGLVVVVRISGIVDCGNGALLVGAGVSMRRLVSYALKHNYRGLAWARGLPGSVGGAVRGNAGAFGGQMGDCVSGVQSISFSCSDVAQWHSHSECHFEYRTSAFKKRQQKMLCVITHIFISLTPSRSMNSEKKYAQSCLSYRLRNHPMEYPTLGSTFKNVSLKNTPVNLQKEFALCVKRDPFPVIPVAALLDAVGLKGFSIGNVSFSLKHPNFLVCDGCATARDVRRCIAYARRMVFKKFAVILEEEIEFFNRV